MVFGTSLAALIIETIFVATGETRAFDRNSLLDVHRELPASLHGVMEGFSTLGNAGEAIGLGMIVSLVLLVTRKYAVAAITCTAPPIAAGLGQAMKLLVQRPRPHLWSNAISPASFSFPSGHAAVSSALAAAVIWAGLQQPSTLLRNILIPASLLFVIGVGLSRLFLGAHWPTDVLGGYATGTAIAALIAFILDPLSSSADQRARERMRERFELGSISSE